MDNYWSNVTNKMTQEETKITIKELKTEVGLTTGKSLRTPTFIGLF